MPNATKTVQKSLQEWAMNEFLNFWRICPEQAGCSAGASTLDNLSALLDMIKHKADKKMATIF